MKYLITTWFGTFLCDEQNIQKHILFPNDEKEILTRLQQIEDNKILAEEKKLTKNYSVIVQEKRLEKLGTWNPSEPYFSRITFEPEHYGFSIDLLQKVTRTLTEKKLQNQLKAEDLQVIQMINAFDDLIHISNLISERISSWSLIPTPPEKKEPFDQIGVTVKNEMNRLEQQITKDMQKIAPNTTQIIGPLIGARLIALAGGIERLAMFPASTIQILGAEKALFRFKKEGGKPPKHGVLFQHPVINKAPREQRGKLARFYAAKISIAIKADVFTKRNIADQLIQDLEKRIQKMNKK
ncbi:MAG: hypothetical protein V1726_03335 [Methanobacteriota archaeon]